MTVLVLLLLWGGSLQRVHSKDARLITPKYLQIYAC